MKIEKVVVKTQFIKLLLALIVNLMVLKVSAQTSESLKTKFDFSGLDENSQNITVPEINEIPRVTPGEEVPPSARKNTVFIIQTEAHKVEGDSYIILTDHTERDYLRALKKLAKYRKGEIIRTPDLALLYKNEIEIERIAKELKDKNVKYIAIAPRIESYTENMVLCAYELLCNLDEDPYLDAFPGILLSNNATSFSNLIERTIHYVPMDRSTLKPMAAAMIPTLTELRSLQKNAIVHNLFTQFDYDIPLLNIYKETAKEAPGLTGLNNFRMDFAGKQFVKKLPTPVEEALQNSSMLVLHGHGTPGASCGLDIDAIPNKLETSIILCGSCFSASSQTSDISPIKVSPDGYEITPRMSFALRAIDNGATVVFGHMRLNNGFPRLFPVLETFIQGRTVGEAYQEIINASIKAGSFNGKDLVVREKPENPKKLEQNGLLYVLLGDPALQPIVDLRQ
jgi:hypothetical protein